MLTSRWGSRAHARWLQSHVSRNADADEPPGVKSLEVV
jgi:hypothetical protein